MSQYLIEKSTFLFLLACLNRRFVRFESLLGEAYQRSRLSSIICDIKRTFDVVFASSFIGRIVDVDNFIGIHSAVSKSRLSRQLNILFRVFTVTAKKIIFKAAFVNKQSDNKTTFLDDFTLSYLATITIVAVISHTICILLLSIKITLSGWLIKIFIVLLGCCVCNSTLSLSTVISESYISKLVKYLPKAKGRQRKTG